MVKPRPLEVVVVLLGLLVLGLAIASPETLDRADRTATLGSLSARSFGESLASDGGFGRGAGSSAGDRSIELRAHASF